MQIGIRERNRMWTRRAPWKRSLLPGQRLNCAARLIKGRNRLPLAAASLQIWKRQTRYTQLWCIFIIYHREMLFLRSKMKFVDCTWIICFDLMWFLERTKTNKNKAPLKYQTNVAEWFSFVCLYFIPVLLKQSLSLDTNNRHLICLPWDSN